MMEFVRRNILYAAVFITGAAVLVIEVLAFRILSPYFGSTIYTTSSVIAVVLAALSIGYYVGGRIADARPSRTWFWILIFLGGLSVVILQFISPLLLSELSLSLSLTYGPLVSSLLLFFLGPFLLGTVSPFAIKLVSMHASERGLGTIAGKVFFYSTVGSIAGSLLTGFVFIPRWGISSVITTTGLILMFFAGVALLAERKIQVAVVLLGVGVGALFGLTDSARTAGNVVFAADGRYEKIAVVDTQYDGFSARILYLDRNPSAGIVRETGEILFSYMKYWRMGELAEEPIERALVLGGGGYIVPREILQEYPDARVDVVEIEPRLEEISRMYFGVPSSSHIQTFLMDGRQFLQRQDGRYDLLFIDAFNSFAGIPAHMATREFFESARESLSESGVLVMNVIGSSDSREPSIVPSIIKTFTSVFPPDHSYVFALKDPEDRGALQNFILVSFAGDYEALESSRLASAGAPLNALASRRVALENLDLSSQIILSDDYSPVEYLTGELLRERMVK